MIIDRTAYTNRWALMHPDTKIVCALGLLAACIASRSPWGSLVALLTASALCCAGARVPLGRYLKFLLAPALFLGPALLGVLLSPVVEGRMLLQAQALGLRFGITHAAAAQAAVLGARAMGAVCCMLLLALTTPMADIMSRLRRLRVPGIVADLMELTYRLIFVLLEQVENMLRSQNLRFGFRTPPIAFRSMGWALGALFARIFRRSTQMALAMECRLGTGSMCVLERCYRPKGWGDWALMAAGAVPLIIGRF